MSLDISPEISPRTSSEGTTEAVATVRVLPGEAALTSFEAERVLARLRAVDAGVALVEARWLYLVQVCGGYDAGRLGELLGVVEARNAGVLRSLRSLADDGEKQVWIGPRVGTAVALVE